MFWETLQNWFFNLSAQYNVNPLVFGSIYVGTIPIFWWFVARVVKNYRRRKSVVPAALGATFCSLSSYIYLIFVGRNVPVWIYVAIVLLIIFAAYSTVKNIRRKIMRGEV
jgi:glycerol-3-phosphate acyltransferase PlsY